MRQCQGCGSFENVKMCPLCYTDRRQAHLCARCWAGHKVACEDNQKKMARGQGATVRQHTFVQVPVAEAPIDDVIDAVKKLQEKGE